MLSFIYFVCFATVSSALILLMTSARFIFTHDFRSIRTFCLEHHFNLSSHTFHSIFFTFLIKQNWMKFKVYFSFYDERAHLSVAKKRNEKIMKCEKSTKFCFWMRNVSMKWRLDWNTIVDCFVGISFNVISLDRNAILFRFRFDDSKWCALALRQ